MPGKTFAEKIFGASAGSIVFKKPDIVLSHDNTASINKTFEKMGGTEVLDPKQLMVVLDHNAPPTTSKLANDYQSIREFAGKQGVNRFYDVGSGICHQLMSQQAKPGIIIVGSDSHTCTAGAFNAFAAGIDRTETAGLWKQGETWFRVPQSMKINLNGRLRESVFPKDIALWIIGMIGSAGANYLSIEFHGDGIQYLTLSERMTIANLASEMGAKNAVFPYDEVLRKFLGTETNYPVWADEDAEYIRTIDIQLDELFPVVACPHHVDNIIAVAEIAGTPVQQGVIGTCTNGRLEDLHVAANVLKGGKINEGFQLLIIPASKEIYLEAMRDGTINTLMNAGANILAPSCGPCLGTGQGIPADGMNVISTANRNFLGRMGNKNANIYLASPSVVAHSALKGKICLPDNTSTTDTFPYKKKQSTTIEISENEKRYSKGVWDYSDADNLNTDQMFAGNLTYEISSAEPEKIVPHLFKGFDPDFSDKVSPGDLIFAGDNFGCGSSREHPAVGLRYSGIKALIVKSVSRIFFRSAVNQGLPIIVLPKAVEAYDRGDTVAINLEDGKLIVGGREFEFAPVPDKLLRILKAGGLVNYLKA